MQNQLPLPRAVNENKNLLSADAQKQIKELMHPAPFRNLILLAKTWLEIALALFLVFEVNEFIFTLFAAVFIATRQNMLGLFVHEQSHQLFGKGVFWDRLVDWFAGYWIGMPVENYRAIHLAHHNHFFSERDPDSRRKSGPDWELPLNSEKMASLLGRDLLGLSLYAYLRGKNSTEKFSREPRVRIAAFYLVVISVLIAANLFTPFLLLWVLPAVTLAQVLVRWGALCEHKYNLKNPTVGDASPLIVPTLLERVLLPNLNFTYHPYHHFYPFVPGSDLPKVHQIYREQALLNHANIFHGYTSYLKFLINPNRHPSKQTFPEVRLPATVELFVEIKRGEWLLAKTENISKTGILASAPNADFTFNQKVLAYFKPSPLSKPESLGLRVVRKSENNQYGLKIETPSVEWLEHIAQIKRNMPS